MSDRKIREEIADEESALYDDEGSRFDYLDEPMTPDEIVRWEFRLDTALDYLRDNGRV